MLDGEGGYTVFGKLAPAAASLDLAALPLGLAHSAKLVRDVPDGGVVTWNDVEVDESSFAVKIRRELENEFRSQNA
ncbi:MAG: hypothetical protein ACK5H2_00205 [Beutenbergiaceae bacterium]